MKNHNCIPLILIIIIGLFFSGVTLAEEKTYKEKHADKVKKMEDDFWAAQKAGETIKVVIVEGNSLFNGTTAPQDKPYGKPYTKEELRAAKFSAERNSQIFFLSKDGTLYYPTPPKGQSISESSNSPRMQRVLSEEQKRGPKLFTWATLVPMVGREVEIHGDIYPGYSGVKGVHIKSVYFEGEYIIGE